MLDCGNGGHWRCRCWAIISQQVRAWRGFRPAGQGRQDNQRHSKDDQNSEHETPHSLKATSHCYSHGNPATHHTIMAPSGWGLTRAQRVCKCMRVPIRGVHPKRRDTQGIWGLLTRGGRLDGLMVPVLSTVYVGGPECTVDGTVFEMWLGALGRLE